MYVCLGYFSSIQGTPVKCLKTIGVRYINIIMIYTNFVFLINGHVVYRLDALELV